MKTATKRRLLKPSGMSKFPLRLMPSVRKRAEEFSVGEGVSLNQFINVAVAEKVTQMEHARWIAQRKKTASVSSAEILAILNRVPDNPPEEWDRLPAGYIPSRPKTKKPRSPKR